MISRIGFVLGVALLAGGTPAWAESSADKVARATARFGEGSYDEALRLLLDAQIDDPTNPIIQYNVGNVQAKLRNHEEARKAFEAARAGADPVVKQRATYNLGNVAYAEGKLEEAIEHFKRALDLDPNDMDAKHNLEVVRQEIKRRLNEAKKRQEQQKQQQQKQQGEKKDGEQGQQQQQQGEKQQGEQQEGEKKEGEKQQGEKQQGEKQQGEQQQGEQQQDEEQQGAQAAPEKQQPKPEEKKGAAPRPRGGKLSKKEAERLLQGVQDNRAKYQRKKAKGRRVRAPRGGRDW